MADVALPPYDVILFFILWGLCLVAYAVHEASVRWCACCKGNQTNHTAGEHEQRLQDANHSSSPDDEVPSSKSIAKTATRDTTQEAPVSSFWSTPRGAMFRRFACYFIGGFIVSWLLTIIIFVSLASSGALSMLLFSPQSASSCTASCTYSTRDGLSGWVDESCCTYDQNVGQTNVYFRGRDGHVVHGYLMRNTTRAHPTQRAAWVLYTHGSGGNIASGYRLQRYQYYLSLGNVAMFVFDYPGYGRSEGSATQDGVMWSAIYAAEWFHMYETRVTSGAGSVLDLFGSPSQPYEVTLPADNTPVDLENVTILGRSMGGAVGSYLASRTSDSRRLVLQSTFSNLEDLATTYFPMFGWSFKNILRDKYDKFSNTDNVKTFPGCLYESHSHNDRWVPYSMGEKVYRSAAAKNTSCSVFVSVDDAKHTQPLTVVERAALKRWIDDQRV